MKQSGITFPYFNNFLYCDILKKFKTNFIIYGTEEGPHMWPKRLPYFLRFFISAIEKNGNVKIKRV